MNSKIVEVKLWIFCLANALEEALCTAAEFKILRIQPKLWFYLVSRGVSMP